MSIRNAQQTIEYEWRRLDAQWSETRSLWRDMQQYNFETLFYAPLEKPLYNYLEALQILDSDLQRIENEIPRI